MLLSSKANKFYLISVMNEGNCALFPLFNLHMQLVFLTKSFMSLKICSYHCIHFTKTILQVRSLINVDLVCGKKTLKV